MAEYQIRLGTPETKIAFKNIIKKILRILHVYEKSLEDSEYDYKQYVYAVIMYISSTNEMVDFNLTDIIINLNNILINDLDKKQIKRIVFECKNIVGHKIDELGDADE